MEHASKIDKDQIRRIVERARLSGVLTQAPAKELVAQPVQTAVTGPVAVELERLPEPGSRERKRRLERHMRTGLDMDFEVLSSFMCLEINAEVSPIRLNAILTKRISEMKADGSFRKVPQVVLEMLDSLRIPNFAPVKEPEYVVAARNGCLVVSGENVESTLRSRSVQGLLRYCEWRIHESELILSGGFVSAFGMDAVKRIWRNCTAALC